MAKDLTQEEIDIIAKATNRISNLLISLRGCRTYEAVKEKTISLNEDSPTNAPMEELITKIHNYEPEV